MNKSKKGHKKAKEIKKKYISILEGLIGVHQGHPQIQAKERPLHSQEEGKWQGGCSCHGVENIWMEPAYLGAQGYYSYHGWLPKGLGSKDLEDESGNGEFGGLARFGMHE